jgi:glyoxylase-like metal-dependent hydrolase (beta-lactamase superfamily II)
VRKICWAAAVVLALAAGGAFSARAAAQDDGGLDVVKVRRNFYMIAGAGGNIGVQIGSDGIVLVHAGTAAASDKVLAALKKLTDLPIRYIISADAGPEFVGGNEKLSRAGYTIFTNALGNPAAVAAMTNGGGASILSHDSVLRRMSSDAAKYSNGAMPSEAFFTPRKALRMNDEGIEILYQPAAHSNADSFVLFRASDVVGTYVIPGHGRVSEQMEVVDYRDMVVLVRDVIADLMKQGKTLDQIKAARPALPYETRYGGKTSTNAFIEAVYKSLAAAKK